MVKITLRGRSHFVVRKKNKPKRAKKQMNLSTFIAEAALSKKLKRIINKFIPHLPLVIRLLKAKVGVQSKRLVVRPPIVAVRPTARPLTVVRLLAVHTEHLRPVAILIQEVVIAIVNLIHQVAKVPIKPRVRVATKHPVRVRTSHLVVVAAIANRQVQRPAKPTDKGKKIRKVNVDLQVAIDYLIIKNI